MYHPLPRAWLLATNKIDITFRSSHHSDVPVHGSGFWVQVDREIMFVTNKHVVDLTYYSPQYEHRGYRIHSLKIRTFSSNGEIGEFIISSASIDAHSDDEVDIALLRNIRAASLRQPNVASATLDILAEKSFIETELDWGSQVSFASFQAWRDSETDRPILRTGIVSSDPSENYEHVHLNRKDVLLLEAFSFAGSSGSPVFANAKGIQLGQGLSGGPSFRPAKIIGLMCGHLDVRAPSKMHSGLSYCHKSDLLLRLIRGMEPVSRLL